MLRSAADLRASKKSPQGLRYPGVGSSGCSAMGNGRETPFCSRASEVWFCQWGFFFTYEDVSLATKGCACVGSPGVLPGALQHPGFTLMLRFKHKEEEKSGR